MTDTFYVLRYLPEVPLTARHHASTEGRYPTWGEAEDARQAMWNGRDLDVLER
jgi:hypothetical protein